MANIPWETMAQDQGELQILMSSGMNFSEAKDELEHRRRIRLQAGMEPHASDNQNWNGFNKTFRLSEQIVQQQKSDARDRVKSMVNEQKQAEQKQALLAKLAQAFAAQQQGAQ